MLIARTNEGRAISFAEICGLVLLETAGTPEVLAEVRSCDYQRARDEVRLSYGDLDWTPTFRRALAAQEGRAP